MYIILLIFSFLFWFLKSIKEIKNIEENDFLIFDCLIKISKKIKYKYNYSETCIYS